MSMPIRFLVLLALFLTSAQSHAANLSKNPQNQSLDDPADKAEKAKTPKDKDKDRITRPLMNYGPFMSYSIVAPWEKPGKLTDLALKAITIKVGKNGEDSLCFDTDSMR